MLTSSSAVLITGATGLIGGEILSELLARGIRNMCAIVRERGPISGANRLAQRLREGGPRNTFTKTAQPRAVAGDVAVGRLGLNKAEGDDISRKVDIVIHCAGETSFVRHSDCWQTNVTGIGHLVDFARRCRRLKLVVYVSSAWNCGVQRDRCLTEDEGANVAGHHVNGYTMSKAKAEQLLRESGLPILIVRPSIVLSAGLSNRRFARGLLWFVPLLQQLDVIPIDPRARLDLVTVGFAAQSTVRLLQLSRQSFDCYHLSSGPRSATSCLELAQCLDRAFCGNLAGRMRRMSRRECITHLLPSKGATAALAHYLPFLNMNTVFENTRLYCTLGDEVPVLRPVSTYLPDLVKLVSRRAALLESTNP